MIVLLLLTYLVLDIMPILWVPDQEHHREKLKQAHIAVICSGKYMAFCMAGHADLTTLKSQMLLSWTLLNQATHCMCALPFFVHVLCL